MGLVEKTFKNSEIIIKEGDTGKSFFQLLEGKADVYAGFGKDDQIKLSVLEAGEYFGEMAILEAYPRNATVVARGPVTAIEIPEEDMDKYFAEDPSRIVELIRHLGNRVCATAADYAEAENLLKELRASEAAKQNKSLFSKIKKHIDVYQSNKNKISEPNADALTEELKKLADDNTGNIKNYRKGLIVFKEGDVNDCMYILRSGMIGMYSNYRHKDELRLAEYRAVSFFGEMGIIASDPRSATAVSEADNTSVEIIRQEDMEEIFRSCPAKVDLILRHLSFRLRKLNIDFLNACREITEIYNKK
ncbi:MAG: cyclic nucleotide-binding domain-containing protein [Clostridiales bacterium]|nr:cyclic nucleotide-binding domain-containing protein [Clostridiales bacterium]